MNSARNKRLDALESNTLTNTEHWIFAYDNWDREVVLDHYGRENIGPDDAVIWISMTSAGDEADYPAGYFDADGRWAEVCEARGIPHRDHVG